MNYGKNTKRLFTLVNTKKNMTQLLNQIGKLEMTVRQKPKPKKAADESLDEMNQSAEKKEEQESNVIKGIDEAIEEFLKDLKDAKEAQE
jgi:hypothetical protein